MYLKLKLENIHVKSKALLQKQLDLWARNYKLAILYFEPSFT